MKNYNNEDIIDVLIITLRNFKSADEILMLLGCIEIILKFSEDLIIKNGYKYKKDINIR